jgi:hypothetical protein
MGQRGQEHIRTHYGLGRVAERWEEIYREVLQRKGLPVNPGGVSLHRQSPAGPADPVSASVDGAAAGGQRNT